ncbi:polysaccharide deacetylase family protein [Anaerotignum sp. MB30-C6]|uniref:polysaccharide deacetylase family protein n=1 Tax=Anaerotignum sp. MB30-C6 TaxID=3070814 RepID=UPI0027DCC2BA|nr:polysaccharide deacetylase family protein [Anaerotignum sp. MB30-C6]WMI81786.1 polysaccharide deacetylase family protein [Anaerotignum sp. MB30-C6]
MFFRRILNKAVGIKICVLTTLLLVSVFFAGTLLSKDIFTAAMEQRGVPVPILMYHSVYSDAKRSSDYIVSPDLFRQDMEYIKEKGYTTIFISDLVAYVKEDKPLPEKPIIITLDDGYLNNLVNVVPILEELEMKAVVSVIGSYSQEFSQVEDKDLAYAHMSWKEIKMLADTGYVEIGNHTYDLHKIGERKGCMKRNGESSQQYTAMLKEDLEKLQVALQEHVGITPTVFAYPYGSISDESFPIIKECGFEAALTCHGKVNMITKDPEQLYHLCRFNRAPQQSTVEFFEGILE